MNRVKIVLLSLSWLILTGFVSENAEAAGEARSAVSVADQFKQALHAADAAAVRETLSENVLIFESGKVESSLEEYASHHMAADMAFMKEMEASILSRTVFEDEAMATVSTVYHLKGTYRGKSLDEKSSETLVMRKINGAWKIVHIHWS